MFHAFGTETTFGCCLKLGRLNLEWSTSIVAKVLEIDLKKFRQDRFQERIEGYMPSAKKPLLAVFWELGRLNSEW